ncbi:dTDP-glucose 4,6-dehydratase [Paenibacillus sp. GCM10023250]|uniref:dTDP-glucose 4,6-dehydratase n=1 Tax=Paenibacillus sp. GCM10023250 TaxID=3252648 RepID=UPI00361AB3C8
MLPDTPKTILVTGGAGFIGSQFIRYLFHRYPTYTIINYDKLTYAGNLDNLADISKTERYHFVRADICDFEAVQSVMNVYRIDAIVNFAAESHVDRSISAPTLFVTSNINGTQTLLEAALRNYVSKFVQISTDEVYGALGDTGYFTEGSPIAPNNPYAACKASADLLVKSYHLTYGLPVNFVRFANTYGPRQHTEKLIPMTISNALQNKPIPIHGEGQSIRDWLYVTDNIQAIDLVLHDGRPGEAYNISARQERRTIDVVSHILQLLDKPPTLIQFVEDRPAQDYRYANDPSKIMRELGWMPRICFEEGIQKTADWYAHSLGFRLSTA